MWDPTTQMRAWDLIFQDQYMKPRATQEFTVMLGVLSFGAQDLDHLLHTLVLLRVVTHIDHLFQVGMMSPIGGTIVGVASPTYLLLTVSTLLSKHNHGTTRSQGC